MASTDILRDFAEFPDWLRRFLTTSVAQSAAEGARATIAAVTTGLPSGSYLAPRFNQWGKPVPTNLSKKARDRTVAQQLWNLSAELTGCDLPKEGYVR